MSTQSTLFDSTPLKPTPAPRLTSSLKEKAILVDHDGGYWEWLRRDRKVESDVATHANISKGAGRYLKNLFLSADQPLVTIRAIVQASRETHRNMTLPWAPSRNLLMNTNALPYKQAQLRHSMDLEKAKAELSSNWWSMISRAASALGPLFDSSDYPDLPSVLSSTYIRHSFHPLADASDVRLSADAAFVAEVKAQVRAEQAATYSAAVLSSWERLLSVVESAVSNLSKNGQKGERYRSEWHDNLSTLIPLLSGLNLDSDPRLDAMATRAQSLLRPDPEEYSVSLEARAKAYTKAQAIYSDLSAIYGTLPGSPKDPA